MLSGVISAVVHPSLIVRPHTKRSAHRVFETDPQSTGWVQNLSWSLFWLMTEARTANESDMNCSGFEVFVRYLAAKNANLDIFV